MINRILTIVAISAFSLTILAACGSGSNNNNSGPSNGPKISVTVLLPGESGGSQIPGTFKPTSCIGINESSLCNMKLTWTNLQAPTESNLNQLSSTFANGGEAFNQSTSACSVQMNESQNGSCIINYNFNPQESSTVTYESAAVFRIIFSSESNNYVAISNPILIQASESVNTTK